MHLQKHALLDTMCTLSNTHCRLSTCALVSDLHAVHLCRMHLLHICIGGVTHACPTTYTAAWTSPCCTCIRQESSPSDLCLCMTPCISHQGVVMNCTHQRWVYLTRCWKVKNTHSLKTAAVLWTAVIEPHLLAGLPWNWVQIHVPLRMNYGHFSSCAIIVYTFLFIR